jgi:hypothetical protein
MAKFTYNNIMHSSTQQTPFFANHGLHSKFDIQGMHKIMNPTTKDQTIWLADVELNLYLTLKKHKGDAKRMSMNIKKNNPTLRSKTKFGFNNISKQKRPLEKLDHQRLNPFPIIKLIIVVVFQLKLLGSMKIHLMFHISLLEPYHAFIIQGKIHDPPPPIEIDGEQEYEMEDILYSRIYNYQFQHLVHWHGQM